ncbi:Dynein heavy chain 8, axonemal [Cricetulus griseus]|uniref:Dynein heavy chain 8, axonemal n=1 Tax=Cricetulus griseus TaxID=10029 RepID=G3HLD1_CRIGR|nr:Dynein heavy chain 8, axonemal [Cricetulus griseus]
MESEEGHTAPRSQSEEASTLEGIPPPRSDEDSAPRLYEDHAPTSEEQAPTSEDMTHPGEESQPTTLGEAPPTPDTPGTAHSVTDYRSLIPSDEETTIPDDDESGSTSRIRPRLTPRPAQSVLSDGLSQASRRASKYRRSMSGIPNLQETLKERQLDPFSKFFEKGGCKTLKFFYQEGDAPGLGARISIEGTVMLKKVDNIDFSKLHTFEEVTAAASNSEMLHQLEEVLMMWYKQIEQVLIESEQMRKEADDSGPLTELEHWKRMSAKFNYIIEQIKGSSCKAVINVLNVAHSKLLKNWRDLDARITDTANESKDNVRYLYTLEKVCQPLYNYDLVSMAHGIQNLINAIRMIHSVSRYYNTSERMTSLFIKVTNQMVTACKAYITDGGTNHVWDQETPAVLKKIQVCERTLFSESKVLTGQFNVIYFCSFMKHGSL